MSASGENDVEGRVLAVVKDVLAVEEDLTSLDANLTEDLGADSLDQLSLFMALEDEFGGTIPEEEAEKLVTLRDIVDYIQGRMEADPAS